MDTSKFAELGLNEQILAGVEALGFTDPTPVQAQAIPLVLAGKDVVASAQTGTGKTAAFALPVLQVIQPYSRAAREQAAQDTPASEANSNESPNHDEPKPDAAGVDGQTTEETPTADQPNADSYNGDSNGNANAGQVLADMAPEDPHISVPMDAGDVAAPADAPAVAPAADSSVSASNGASAEDAPRKPRRRHHKKATALPVKDSDESAKPSKRAKGKKSASKADDEADAKSAKRSASGGAKSDVKSDAKPKRKRRRKHAKKRQADGVAEQIASAVDPNAHPFGPFALVITPTRELAQQIDDVVSTVCEHTDQRAVIVMGGAKFDRQIRELQRGCDMLVATPGRLIDLMDHDHVDLSQVKVLVLDEADRMLDMGFWPSVRRIVSALPKDRQTLLFSATIPPSIKGTVDAMLHDPAQVEIARIGQTADTVEEHLCPVTQGQKIELLEALVRKYDPERVLVFCRTKHRVDDVSKYLRSAGMNVDVMHADRTQKERERALAKFRAGKCQILVATDVMSRGIDVSGIDAVVNFDVPMDPEDYVHRIGRTGRAGHTGLAFTFVAPDEISPLREIEYFTHKLIPVWDLDGFDYDSTRIVPNPDRSTKKPTRMMF
ncbi:MAG: DEAD/DEAH box helicase, partial [Atopobiaceae bacterium]